MNFKVWLEGDPFDLQAVSQQLTDGPTRVVYDSAEDAYYLTSAEIDAQPDVGKANTVALRIIGWLNGLGRIGDAHFKPLLISRFADEEGRSHVVGVLGASTATVRMRIQVTVTQTDGTVVHPPPSPLPNYLALADNNPDVTEALDIMSRPEPLGWVELYKVHEIIRSSIRPKKVHDLRWAEKMTDSAFTGSANLPGVSGSGARHARMDGAPNRTMTLEEGRTYIGGLATKWLNWLTSEPIKGGR